MNKLSTAKRVAVISALVEGCSVRSTPRLRRLHDAAIRNVPAKRVQIDEIWSFVACKQKNLKAEITEKNPRAGDVWTFVAIEAQTKLVLSWLGWASGCRMRHRVHA